MAAVTEQRSIAERNELVEANLGLAGHAVKLFARSSPAAIDVLGGFDDAMQIAYVALIRAAERFDPSIARFSTFAIRSMCCALASAGKDAGLIRIPRWLDGERRAAALERVAALSLHGVRGDGLDPPAPLEVDPDGRLPAIREAMRCLTARQRFVLSRRSHGARLADLAAELGLCRERVRQIEAQALAHLRRLLGVEAEDSFRRASSRSATAKCSTALVFSCPGG